MPVLISIIMPVYNAALSLENAVNSVLKQDFETWELIIVNDGSTDASGIILQQYSDSRIRVFNQPNKGVSAARNMGLKLMQGDFFCFLDADDELTPTSISSRIMRFQQESIKFVDGVVDVYDAHSKQKIRTWYPKTTGKVFSDLVRLNGKCFFGPTWMVRRNRNVAYRFDEALKYCEDLFFYISIAEMGEYVYTDSVVLKYNKSKTSAMSNLFGLAEGYSELKKRLLKMHVGFPDILIYELRSRKAMFLSFLDAGKILPAIRYLLSGKGS